MFASTAWWNYELFFRSRYCALTSFFLNWCSLSSWWLEGSASMMSLHSSYYSSSLNYRHLFFETSLHYSLLVGDYVCDLSYKSNAFVWLENFIRNNYTSKFLCINDHATTLANTTFIHISLKISRCLPSLPGQHWDCALIQYVSEEVSF